jgi:DivIVA domain-containing protein
MDRLKPVDVRNVAFRKPPIGKRGYDEKEVDEFLDHVERTLTELYQEIAHLRGEPTSIGKASWQELTQAGGKSGPMSEPNAAEHAILAELDQIKLRLARIETAVTSTPRPTTFGNF